MSSSRHPDKWIVPGGGMEPEEEPSVAAVREVCEEVSFVIEFQQLLYLAYPFLNNCICFFYLLSILT